MDAWDYDINTSPTPLDTLHLFLLEDILDTNAEDVLFVLDTVSQGTLEQSFSNKKYSSHIAIRRSQISWDQAEIKEKSTIFLFCFSVSMILSFHNVVVSRWLQENYQVYDFDI